MPLFSRARYALMGILLICMSLSGCWHADKTVPFPSSETEYTRPVAKPFKFSDPVRIEWKVSGPDSIKSPVTSKFSLAALPSRPFLLGGPERLAKPLTAKKFEWNSLPETELNINDLPSDTLEISTVKLLPPKVIVSPGPLPLAGLTRGVLDASPIGLPGIARDYLNDPSGALWIGTTKGLCRYDGTYLEIYALEQGLTDIDIISLYRDKRSRIWIGTNTGSVMILDETKGTVDLLEDKFPSLVGAVFNMLEDRNGQMWLPSFGLGIFIFDPVTHTVRHLSDQQGLPNPAIVAVMQDTDGLIWISTTAGAAIVDPIKNKLKIFDASHGLATRGVVGLFQAKNGEVWVGGRGDITIMDRQTGTLKYLGEEQGLKSKGETVSWAAFMQDAKGNIWMGGDDGTALSFNPKLNTFERFKVNPGNTIYHIVADREGQIWFGSRQGNTPVLNFRNGRPGNFNKSDGLASSSVWGTLEAADGKIWLGTYNGVDVYDPGKKTIQHIGIKEGLLDVRSSLLYEDSKERIWVGANNTGISIIDSKNGSIQKMTAAQGLSAPAAGVFYEEKNGDMWVGGTGGSIYIINPEARQEKRILNLPGWEGSYVNTIIEDHKGQLWITSNAGAVVIDPERRTMKFMNEDHGLVNNNATTLYEDSRGNLWVGTAGGLSIINPANDSVATMTSAEGLADNGVFTLNERNGNIYAGTTNGLSVITPLTLRDNRLDFRFASFGKHEGLGAIDFAENSSMFTKRGQYWAGVEDLILLVMDSIETDTSRRAPYIAAINLFDKRHDFRDRASLPKDHYLIKNNIAWDSIETVFYIPQNLVLPYNQNYVSFNYAAMRLSNATAMRFRYMLEGIDKSWSAITDKVITENYRDLPPGHYTFKVASRGLNGEWSKPGQVSFVITPPWWKTWWAYALYAIAFFGLLTSYVSFRSRALKMENQLLEEKVVSRTNDLQKSLDDLKQTQRQLVQSEKMASLGELTAGIAHEIQNPLNFVNNFSDVNKELIAELKQELAAGNTAGALTIADDISGNEEKIIFHGKRADAIVKSMLQHSRSGDSKKEHTDINALADEYLRLSYHGLRAKDKSFNASMKTDFGSDVGKVNVIPQDFGRVILNLINNAFYAVSEKKSQAVANGQSFDPTVTVSTRRIGDRVEIRVADNGNGIPQHIIDKIYNPFFTTKPSGHGTGLGLSLSYDIVTKAHGGELNVKTVVGEGTTFIVVIPG